MNAEGLQVLRDTQKAVPKEAIREQVRQVLASRVPPDPAQLDWNGDYYVVSNTGGVGLYSHDMETLFSTRIKYGVLYHRLPPSLVPGAGRAVLGDRPV